MSESGSYEFATGSPDASVDAGKRLGLSLSGGLVIGLVGTLGSGKTHFVKGLALGNGLTDARHVTSPTFSLVNEYPGRWHFYHIDVYRLGGADDLSALGFEDFMDGQSVTVVEWADRVVGVLPEDYLRIDIEISGDTQRRFTATASGPVSCDCLERWRRRSSPVV